MTTSKHTISAAQLAELSQVKPEEIDYWVARNEKTASWPIELNSAISKKFCYGDALAVEIARQINDNTGITSGPSVLESLRIVSYSAAVPLYFEYIAGQSHLAKAMTDFWLAVSSARNSWGPGPRGNTPELTSFGSAEYWSNMHFTGSFDQVCLAIKQWMTKETTEYTDTDPGRVFMVDISTADRRLRKRAGEMSIEIAGNSFV